ncbi:hypothetical protein EsVE80_23360 [Enterococcus saigonensis]|uniref:Sugar transporter SemiSWEET n=2 Tax=Enterococcus saigonensis TaxID=1805431 RepID=A0A679IFA9_9ENTE|nr:SemiSWEET transporter [Enterococcus saigonensis]BCA86813.1 hypothetical protein EsVE80_23360 [Enterococcus saigonensis]
MIALGLIAGVLTGISFIPQSIKTIRTKDTSSISLSTYILYTLGVMLWIIYGLIIEDFAVFLTNIVTIVPCVIILVIKLGEKSRKTKSLSHNHKENGKYMYNK